jgi:hypothetical protein
MYRSLVVPPSKDNQHLTLCHKYSRLSLRISLSAAPVEGAVPGLEKCPTLPLRCVFQGQGLIHINERQPFKRYK